MLIQIIAEQCENAHVTFDNMDLALAFVRMLAGNLTPDLFVDMAHKLMDSSKAVEMAKEIVKACTLPGA